MDYYTMETVIANLKALIKLKEDELNILQSDANANTVHAIQIQQLIFEISELKIQVQYHENRLTDEMANRCKSCENGCRACWFNMH